MSENREKEISKCACCGLEENEGYGVVKKLMRREYLRTLIYDMCVECHNNLMTWMEEQPVACESTKAHYMIEYSIKHGTPEDVQHWTDVQWKHTHKMRRALRNYISRGSAPIDIGAELREALELDD